MSKELLLVVDAVSNEKGVSKEVIFEAMEAALASAAKKRYPNEEVLARVSINKQSGEYETFRRWEVVADDVVMESPDWQIRQMDAVEMKADSQVGDFLEEQIENPEFGRIAAQAAKQVIVTKVRDAERERQYEEYKDRQGEIITGVVKRVEFGHIVVDLGRAEGVIRRDQQIPLLRQQQFLFQRRQPEEVGCRAGPLGDRLQPGLGTECSVYAPSSFLGQPWWYYGRALRFRRCRLFVGS